MTRRMWLARLAVVAALAGMAGVVGASAQAADPPDWDGDGAVGSDCRPLDPAVHPGATDYPDLAFEDVNCDGIDGDKANAYFVQPSGNDLNVGSSNAPFQTIQRAIDAARTSGTKAIYVATGTYNQRLSLPGDADGIRIHGGYEAGTWQRTTSTVTTVNGQPETMLLDGARDVVVQLATLNGTRGGSTSAYGVRAVNNSEIALIRATSTAGAGATGGNGGGGSQPAKAAAGAAGNPPPNCDNAGTGGSGANHSGNGFDGGAGGTGGEETNDGENGGAGAEGGGGPSGGDGGGGGVDLAGDPNMNDPQATPDWDGDGDTDGWDMLVGKPGANGAAGSTGGHGGGGGNDFGAAGATWAGRSGGSGSAGGVGFGGGGGGGGAGRGAFFEWQAGAGGGQGGDGGGAGTPGGGAGPGGGSFGLYLHDSQGTVVDGSTLQSANGGPGGTGGPGGPGGTGGDGASGAIVLVNCGKTSGDGGDGGNGGQGGTGGSGGGGSGGPSAALMRLGTATATDSGSTVANGSGGSGGTGGNLGTGGQSGPRLPAGSGGVTDFDGDGIADSSDACVEVPRGTDANGDGCPDRPAAFPDGDGDGVPNDGRDACPSEPAGDTDANHDGCADVAATPTPTPTPTPTDTTTGSTPATVPGGKIDARVQTFWSRFGKRTRVGKLTVTGAPVGSTVTLTCKSKGKSCPFKRLKLSVRGSRLVLAGKFKKRKLPAKTVITIVVAKDGMVAKRFRYTTQAKKFPTVVVT